MHHSRDKCRGYLYKRGQEVKFFNIKQYHKRYFIISVHQKALYIQENVVSKKVTKIPHSDLLYIDSVYDHTEKGLSNLDEKGRKKVGSVGCKFKFSFTLVAQKRRFILYARTQEE